MAAECPYNNIEYSLIDYITAKALAAGYSITVSKNYKFVEAGQLPTIVLGLLNSITTTLEVGSKKLMQKPTVIIRIFATSDAERLNLAHWLLTILMDTIPFYTYTIVNGAISAKVANGNISILKTEFNGKEYEMVGDLEPEDRYRHKFIMTLAAGGMTW